ncbi:hypothetical protein CHS0354_018534 [Potamilus streckersoni]|uniref:3-oxoacyl-[acyl-carrier-protein] reductase n=1 Tax=Potamilus streckersoni TaxID=2493646 RepID=A0AAE0TBW9_9BIVA|nr:hypothetical protein CHS0354_018534 [Potamilus streckersoni]
MEPSAWDDVLKTNLNTMFYVIRQFVDSMAERKFGRIINIASVNGHKGQFGQTNYSAAKAGVYGLTKSLAYETAVHGITTDTMFFNPFNAGQNSGNMFAGFNPADAYKSFNDLFSGTNASGGNFSHLGNMFGSFPFSNFPGANSFQFQQMPQHYLFSLFGHLQELAGELSKLLEIPQIKHLPNFSRNTAVFWKSCPAAFTIHCFQICPLTHRHKRGQRACAIFWHIRKITQLMRP